MNFLRQLNKILVNTPTLFSRLSLSRKVLQVENKRYYLTLFMEFLKKNIPSTIYILLAIGKTVQPINIIIVSRISNYRFIICLSSKHVQGNLMQHTQSININDQIRRLKNSAKWIFISHVCPSITNFPILDALKSIDINHLKVALTCKVMNTLWAFVGKCLLIT